MDAPWDPVDVIRRSGGAARTADLLAWTTRHRLRTAVARGTVSRVGRGVHVLPEFPEPRALAARCGGVLSHGTAAQCWGIQQVLPPASVHVTVPRGARRVEAPGLTLHWASLRPDDVRKGVTTPLRTVLDCSVALPFGEALAVADSALANSFVHLNRLREAAETTRGPGRGRRKRVAAHTDRLAENPFESALRAIVIETGLSGFGPQCPVRLPTHVIRVDLGDPARKVALEADSFAHHGGRSALARDCERYDELVAAGWLVLRFAWEHVMFRPAWVAEVVRRTCALRDECPQPERRQK